MIDGLSFLWEGIMAITWKEIVMYIVGGTLIWLAIKKQYEPSLLLPMGFGAILVNLPMSSALNQVMEGAGISAFPMSARVIQKMGLAENPTNHLLMHAIGANVPGQIASAVAGGIILGFFR